jgi:hypothetical protein
LKNIDDFPFMLSLCAIRNAAKLYFIFRSCRTTAGTAKLSAVPEGRF